MDASSNNMMMPSSMDPMQFQQTQQTQQHMQHSPVSQQPHASLMHNGNARHPSPGFQTPSYHVNPVVPLKRARPREDSVNISPRQTAGVLPSSRSQTPQSGASQVSGGQMYHLYGAGNPNVPQRPLSATPFIPQLGQGAPNNGTPSPIMQSQVYKTPNTGAIASTGQPPPKRMATQSPSPFSPANQQHIFLPQGSPTSEHSATRSATPHGFPPQPQHSPGFNAGFGVQPQRAFSPPNAPGASMNVTPNFPGNPQAQAMYSQLQRQQQQQQHKLIQQSTQMQGGQLIAHHGRNVPVSTLPGSHPNPNAKVTGRGAPNPDQFARSLQDFMQKRGTPIATLTPPMGDRQIHLFPLYLQVQRFGGHRNVTGNNQWASVAQSLQINTEVNPGIADQLAQVYQATLAPFEDAYRKSTQAQQTISMPGPNSGMASHSNMVKQPPLTSQSPTKQPQDPAVLNFPGPNPNGFQNSNASFPQNLPSSKAVPHVGTHSSFPPAVTSGAMQFNPNQIPNKGAPPTQQVAPGLPQQSDISQSGGNPVREKHDLHFKPKVRGLDTHGGVDVAVLSGIGTEIVHLRPTVPTFNELGIIDVHALTMSLKSGLQAEVRLALDTLVTVSVESQWSLSLKSCEDLVETLVDVAESEVLLLKDSVVELDDEPFFPPYEEVLRGCRQEANTLLAVPKVGSRPYELDRAADRLIAITTIFRNLSFFESNHDPLAESSVIKFVASVIDIMCNTKLLLRSNNNTLDFMKDMIIFLSNLSQSIILPGKQEALGLLRFILAFAPQPGPYSAGRSLPLFASYHPSIHRYLPPAVDSLAKLLVRDEPNRGFFKELFSAAPGTDRPWDILTRSFALAISPIPVADNVRMMLPQAVEARKPYLEQGMLAAEILSGIAAQEDCHLALSWLSSEDGFAHSLVRLVYFLSTQQQMIRPVGGRGSSYQDDGQPFSRIIQRGATVLRNLSMTSGGECGYDGLLGSIETLNLLDNEADSLKSMFLAGMASKKEILFGALMNQSIDAKALNSMCEFTGFGGSYTEKDDVF
ncbi:hypothetical protein H072_9133 [Dactylellina haptotyla CBS 200.50]|uniref:ARID domain-containing protein n=1 Tax=Dactylellina haptotyla (strain CBS 200.50) TaxID=1284197 RepID=S8A396_DACHA|nr:hypothetical protein H072_9133 [Dactylellina haptotyla CBS 200.50]